VHLKRYKTLRIACNLVEGPGLSKENVDFALLSHVPKCFIQAELFCHFNCRTGNARISMW